MDYDRTFEIETDEGIKLKVYISGELINELVFFHHGAGYTAQTWLPLIESLRKSLPDACFVAFDMRGHGQSSFTDDYDIKRLVNDSKIVLETVALGTDSVETFLIGHSLGAAVFSALPETLNDRNLNQSTNIKLSGLVMIDIIEETATASLNRMSEIIKEIPKSFENLQSAFEWSFSTLNSHTHHCPLTNFHSKPWIIEGIKKSLRSQLKLKLKTTNSNSNSESLEWITDLSKMESFWNSWFNGLTKNFIKFPGSRILVLADTDYMDREMIVAQMQGKFQLSVIRQCGHAIQEDRPDELAVHIDGMIQKHLKLSQILRNRSKQEEEQEELIIINK